MVEYKEKHNIDYSCRCTHEIALLPGGVWEATGNNQDCEKHKVVE